ncbi:MAG: hypothetical protein JRG92_13400 [Deltaproteobacteria bacterium]|jgi:hypothetical protein|nr:hypothetical protein [Deltaproteobacteria bacterium]MBW2384629.1 hypothetical protein [Deltaproteobacteria bacterium]MBW2697308.1 hypothetical protein [Deltaproteobacteria bacterium]
MSSSQTKPEPVTESWHSSELPLSEAESHREHAAALAATVFRKSGADDELVLELEGGRLRLRARTG